MRGNNIKKGLLIKLSNELGFTICQTSKEIIVKTNNNILSL